MDMQGSRTLGITQQQAWEALNDPETLQLCVPGCDRMARVEGEANTTYDVGLKVKVGPVSARFIGRITLSDVQPPERYTLAFEGQGGVAGFGKGGAQVVLVPTAEGCELRYSVTAQVGGKVAQLGQRLVDGAARSLADDFFRRFDEEMQRRHGPATVPDAG